MSGCDWPPDWPPRDSPNWRPLLDAIEFLCRRFRSVLKTEAKLCTWLNSSDDPPNFLPSLLVGWDGERKPLTGEIRLALWFSKDNPGEFSGSADDIDIARGELEKLELPSILILWPRLERLYELTVAQPEPAAQPEAEPEPEPEPKQPTRRPRRKTERAKQRLEITLAIVSKHCPDHADEAPVDVVRWVQDVAPADAVRWVQEGWKDEVEARGKTIQELPCPVRTTIEIDLGFQTRQSAAKRGKKSQT